jgi:hypothetical protein
VFALHAAGLPSITRINVVAIVSSSATEGCQLQPVMVRPRTGTNALRLSPLA